LQGPGCRRGSVAALAPSMGSTPMLHVDCSVPVSASSCDALLEPRFQGPATAADPHHPDNTSGTTPLDALFDHEVVLFSAAPETGGDACSYSCYREAAAKVILHRDSPTTVHADLSQRCNAGVERHEQILAALQGLQERHVAGRLRRARGYPGGSLRGSPVLCRALPPREDPSC